LVAAALVNDPDHESCAAWFRSITRPMIVPDVVIPEVSYLLAKGAQAPVEAAFLRSLVAGRLVAEHDVEPIFIEKGSPQQNPFVERFNGTMRRDLLNLEEFNNIVEARVVIANWNAEYNEQRPHRALGMMTPLAFARSHSVVGQ
jgi:transposase InsO family protein